MNARNDEKSSSDPIIRHSHLIAPSIRTLIQRIDAIKGNEHLSEDEITQQLGQLMKEFPLRNRDLKKYALVEESAPYTRNLIWETDTYALILMCWKPRTNSPIHTHGGSNCWAKIVNGEVCERRYTAGHEIDGKKGEPVLISEEIQEVGTVTYIDDSLGLHSLSNPTNNDPHGHKAGANKIIDFLGWCDDAQVKVVTLWLLSTDNFKRSQEEIDELLIIIGKTVDELAATGRWNIKAVGALDLLPPWLEEKLSSLKPIRNDGVEVNVAISYGGRREIVDAVKSYLNEEEAAGHSIKEAKEKLTTEDISKFLYTAGQPDPELLIRTSGEQRLGGFLLWQSALSEFYFCEAYWPDFRRVDFLRALRSYSVRQRRFGS